MHDPSRSLFERLIDSDWYEPGPVPDKSYVARTELPVYWTRFNVSSRLTRSGKALVTKLFGLVFVIFDLKLTFDFRNGHCNSTHQS